jgi:hypothetical protein
MFQIALDYIKAKHNLDRIKNRTDDEVPMKAIIKSRIEGFVFNLKTKRFGTRINGSQIFFFNSYSAI